MRLVVSVTVEPAIDFSAAEPLAFAWQVPRPVVPPQRPDVLRNALVSCLDVSTFATLRACVLPAQGVECGGAPVLDATRDLRVPLATSPVSIAGDAGAAAETCPQAPGCAGEGRVLVLYELTGPASCGPLTVTRSGTDLVLRW